MDFDLTTYNFVYNEQELKHASQNENKRNSEPETDAWSQTLCRCDPLCLSDIVPEIKKKMLQTH